MFCSCGNTNEKIEYFENGNYKVIRYNHNGDTLLSYFSKDGTKDSEGYKMGEVEYLTTFYDNGQTEEGKFKNGKRLGWHNFYDSTGVKLGEVFYQNDKVYQQKSFLRNGSIDYENSVYIDFSLPRDTLHRNEDTPVHMKFYNEKSRYEFVRAYLSNEIKYDFSNVDKVVLDTFGCAPGKNDIYVLVNIPDTGKQYIRGYLYDGVVIDTVKDFYNYDGIKVLFEKEVYVK